MSISKRCKHYNINVIDNRDNMELLYVSYCRNLTDDTTKIFCNDHNNDDVIAFKNRENNIFNIELLIMLNNNYNSNLKVFSLDSMTFLLKNNKINKKINRFYMQ